MRVCIPSRKPGGPDSVIPDHFNEMEVIDYYELRPDGEFEQSAQSVFCGGGCYDVVEAMILRKVEALVVGGMSPSTLQRFRMAGIKVYRANGAEVRSLLRSLASGSLKQLDPKQAASN
ncbi:MAG: NifB/NifX family molybdenum-iron cluster-binding protein [Candidatus Thermoplasmatota archaeon]|nr:NifB/NifX family molybdenum-iron cluster-binding protein [Candidatus Thermoplasmatota archaeon]